MLKKIVIIGLAFILIVSCTSLGINSYVKNSVSENMLTPEQIKDIQDIDCILILGCGVREDGTPSNMLEDRLICGIDLYKSGCSQKILMSGDHGQTDYNEVGVMKEYAKASQIPSEDVFMDHAGFSTYESIYRAKEIFGVDRMVIVTQEYHLYRALYIAEQFGIEAYGVSSSYNDYGGQYLRDAREILARVKDFGKSIIKPKPTYLGEYIPISSNGDLTNDEIEL